MLHSWPAYPVLESWGSSTRYVSFLYTPLVQVWKCLIFYGQCVNALCLHWECFFVSSNTLVSLACRKESFPLHMAWKLATNTWFHLLITSFSFRAKSATPYFVLSRSAVSFLNFFTYGRVSGCPGIYYILLAHYPRIDPLNVEISKNTFRSTSGTTIPSSVW